MHIPHLILLAVAAQRAGEMIYAAKNTRRAFALGAREYYPRHYPLFIFLHASWLISLAAQVNAATPVVPLPLSLFLLAQLGRVWVIATLGRQWTTRIIRIPGAPVIQTGPYRYLRHPNYLIVAAEIALLPLAFGFWNTAAIFSVLNAALLGYRIRLENRILAGIQQG